MVGNELPEQTQATRLMRFQRVYQPAIACVAALVLYQSVASRCYSLMWLALSMLTLAAHQAIESWKSPSMSTKAAGRLRIVLSSLNWLGVIWLALASIALYCETRRPGAPPL